MIFFAHSGLRYLVLLTGIIAVLYLAYAVATKRNDDRVGRILGSAFGGLLDLQILLGLLMVVFGLFYSALLGHLFMMIGAAASTHVSLRMAKTSETPERANRLRLLGIALALVLIVGGILAIGREVFGSGSPSMV